MREHKNTPQRMVTEGKVTGFGAFKEPFTEINLLDLDLKFGGRTVPRLLRDFRLKEWQYYGVIHEDYYFGIVIFDSKYVGLSFFTAFDRGSGKLLEHERKSFGAPLRISRELLHGNCYFRQFGYWMEFENRLHNGLHRVVVNIKPKKGSPGVKAELYFHEDLDKLQPLIVVNPIDNNRPFYTHKIACPVEGSIDLNGKRIELLRDKHIGLMDVQKTYYKYNSFWKWAMFGGYDRRGRLIGMNACENVIADDDEFNENCTWVDGRITLMPAVRFNFEEDNHMEDWRIVSHDGMMDLVFKPVGARCDRLNAGIILTDFKQPYGNFQGYMPGPDGEQIKVDGLFGLCEHHIARF